MPRTLFSPRFLSVVQCRCRSLTFPALADSRHTRRTLSRERPRSLATRWNAGRDSNAERSAIRRLNSPLTEPLSRCDRRLYPVPAISSPTQSLPPFASLSSEGVQSIRPTLTTLLEACLDCLASLTRRTCLHFLLLFTLYPNFPPLYSLCAAVVDLVWCGSTSLSDQREIACCGMLSGVIHGRHAGLK